MCQYSVLLLQECHVWYHMSNLYDIHKHVSVCRHAAETITDRVITANQDASGCQYCKQLMQSAGYVRYVQELASIVPASAYSFVTGHANCTYSHKARISHCDNGIKNQKNNLIWAMLTADLKHECQNPASDSL